MPGLGAAIITKGLCPAKQSTVLLRLPVGCPRHIPIGVLQTLTHRQVCLIGYLGYLVLDNQPSQQALYIDP